FGANCAEATAGSASTARANKKRVPMNCPPTGDSVHPIFESSVKAYIVVLLTGNSSSRYAISRSAQGGGVDFLTSFGTDPICASRVPRLRAPTATRNSAMELGEVPRRRFFENLRHLGSKFPRGSRDSQRQRQGKALRLAFCRVSEVRNRAR